MERKMQCPNCKSQISDEVNKCGVCGVHIDTHPTPVNAGFPNWAKGLLLGTFVGLLILCFLGAVYYFFYLQPAQSAPQPAQAVTVVVAPPTQIASTPTIEVPPSQIPMPSETLVPTQSPTPIPTSEPQFCDAFEGIKMTTVYMDWKKGEPLELYIKMPGGVPGLEKEITGASGEWNYRVEIGNHNSLQCDIIKGYRERLYCQIILPDEYESAVQPMSLYVNKCETDVYANESAFLPEIKK